GLPLIAVDELLDGLVQAPLETDELSGVAEVPRVLARDLDAGETVFGLERPEVLHDHGALSGRERESPAREEGDLDPGDEVDPGEVQGLGADVHELDELEVLARVR